MWNLSSDDAAKPVSRADRMLRCERSKAQNRKPVAKERNDCLPLTVFVRPEHRCGRVLVLPVIRACSPQGADHCVQKCLRLGRGAYTHRPSTLRAARFSANVK